MSERSPPQHIYTCPTCGAGVTEPICNKTGIITADMQGWTYITMADDDIRAVGRGMSRILVVPSDKVELTRAFLATIT